MKKSKSHHKQTTMLEPEWNSDDMLSDETVVETTMQVIEMQMIHGMKLAELVINSLPKESMTEEKAFAIFYRANQEVAKSWDRFGSQ